MTNYTTLLGAEDVRSAASKMVDAADTINRAVGNLEEVLFRSLNRFDEYVCRLEALAEKAAPAESETGNE